MSARLERYAAGKEQAPAAQGGASLGDALASSVALAQLNKIVEQRDFYDLWGDIFDNIPFFRRVYRGFMRWKFG